MNKQKIIFTNGCFDIVHRGHLELFDYCAGLGNLIIGLNSDESVKKLKGKNRPINNQADRIKLLLSLKQVNEVHLFDELTPYELIKKIKPDIIVKGGDYTKNQVVGNDICEVIIFNFIDGYSTTKLIDRIVTEHE